jgi:hypothetical protein
MSTISENEISKFYNGMREGVTLYAHWRDGVQYVGTTGKTLSKAIANIDAEEKEHLNKIEGQND